MKNFFCLRYLFLLTFYTFYVAPSNAEMSSTEFERESAFWPRYVKVNVNYLEKEFYPTPKDLPEDHSALFIRAENGHAVLNVNNYIYRIPIFATDALQRAKEIKNNPELKDSPLFFNSVQGAIKIPITPSTLDEINPSAYVAAKFWILYLYSSADRSTQMESALESLANSFVPSPRTPTIRILYVPMSKDSGWSSFNSEQPLLLPFPQSQSILQSLALDTVYPQIILLDANCKIILSVKNNQLLPSLERELNSRMLLIPE